MLTSVIPPSGNAYLWVVTVVLSNIYHCSLIMPFLPFQLKMLLLCQEDMCVLSHFD